jgi:hypothetical protein
MQQVGTVVGVTGLHEPFRCFPTPTCGSVGVGIGIVPKKWEVLSHRQGHVTNTSHQMVHQNSQSGTNQSISSPFVIQISISFVQFQLGQIFECF